VDDSAASRVARWRHSVARLIWRGLHRQFGADQLAGISIVASVLLGEYLADATTQHDSQDTPRNSCSAKLDSFALCGSMSASTSTSGSSYWRTSKPYGID
jgi:hypothetical protein